MLGYRCLRTNLTARIGILGSALSFVAAIASLLAGEEQAQAVPALQKEEGGGKKQSADSSAPHKIHCRGAGATASKIPRTKGPEEPRGLKLKARPTTAPPTPRLTQGY